MRRSSVYAMFLCLGTLAVMSPTPQALASTYTVSIVQSGSNVVATGSGSLSVSGTTDNGSAHGVNAGWGFLVLGTGENTVYTGVSGPSSFGSGGLFAPSSSTGGDVGFIDAWNQYVVPVGYTAGSLLTATDVWNNTTLSGLGLTAGTYTYTLGSSDKFVINIGSSVSPTPEPGSIVLLGTGILGVAGAFRKRFA